MTFHPGSVEALLFDLGGVVIEVDFERCLSRWATSAGTSIDELRSRFGQDAAYEAHERGELDAEGYFAAVRATLALDLDDDTLRSGWVGIYGGVVPGIGPLLAAAKHTFPLFAFTNSNPTHMAFCAERFGDDLAVFEETFVSSDLGLRKPDEAAFHAVARRMGVAPPNILFLDDGAANVEGARSAGLQAVQVTSPDSVRHALERVGVRVPA